MRFLVDIYMVLNSGKIRAGDKDLEDTTYKWQQNQLYWQITVGGECRAVLGGIISLLHKGKRLIPVRFCVQFCAYVYQILKGICDPVKITMEYWNGIRMVHLNAEETWEY